MIEKIAKFYRNNGLPEILIKSKCAMYEKNLDIADELVLWITENKYKESGCVEIDGYSAKKLAEMSPFLNGDGAFEMLIELRNNPDQARKMLEGGLKKK